MIESLAGQGMNVRTCTIMVGVSESGYYDWNDRPLFTRALRRVWLGGDGVGDVAGSVEITGRNPALMIVGAWTVLIGRRAILCPSFRATLLATTHRYGHDQHNQYDRYGNHNDDDTCTDSQRNEHALKPTADA